MEVIGHRGCGGQYPENTIHAIEQSSRYLTTIEIDVRRCGTGELVVFHDETLDRLTDAEGRVAETAWERLSELEILDSGETVPLLSEMLGSFPGGVAAQVELKDTGLAADVYDVVSGTDVGVHVSSFIPEALAELGDLKWDATAGYLFEDDPDEGMATARELGCEYVHPHYELCLETDIVTKAHEADLGVIAWDGGVSADVIEAVREVGVDGITADRWDFR